MIEITLENATKWVTEAVRGREDFCHEGYCVYIKNHSGKWNDNGEYVFDLTNATPSCLVGEALITHGGLGMLDILEDGRNSVIIDTLLDSLRERGKVTCTNEAERFLMIVQDAQDLGLSWGEALAKAKGTEA